MNVLFSRPVVCKLDGKLTVLKTSYINFQNARKGSMAIIVYRNAARRVQPLEDVTTQTEIALVVAWRAGEGTCVTGVKFL